MHIGPTYRSLYHFVLFTIRASKKELLLVFSNMQKAYKRCLLKCVFEYVECKTNVHEKCAYLILQFSALLQVKGPWQKYQVLSVLSNSIFKNQTSNQRKQYIWRQRQNAKINRMICLVQTLNALQTHYKHSC